MTKRKIHKLLIDDLNQFKLLGISAHENDYRLSWAANSRLGLKFRKSENIQVRNGDLEKLEFSVFQCSEEGPNKMNLISNRCPNGFLVNEMKNIDFFLQIFGDISQSSIDELCTGLKNIDIVSAVFEIAPGKLKKKWNLPSE